MTIGEALKSFRLKANLTQAEMAGDIMNESFYSKVERDIHHIDAQDLMAMLVANHIDIVAFFSMLGNQPNVENPTFELEAEMGYAQNKRDLKALEKIEAKISKLDLTRQQKMRIEVRGEIARAWILHSNKGVTTKVKNRVKKVLTRRWDRMSYHYLGQAVILLDIKESYELVKSAFDYYRKHPERDTFSLQFVALLAVNYLNCCYHQEAGDYGQIAIKFLEDLPIDPTLGFFKMLGIYYQSIFENDEDSRLALLQIIKRVGFYAAIADTDPQN